MGKAKLQSFPTVVFDGIWDKAKQLINTSGQVLEGPVHPASKTSYRPYLVQHYNKSHFSCDFSWPIWWSSKICAHCIAAAEFAFCLQEFVLVPWYNKSKSKRNLDKLFNAKRKGKVTKKKATACFTLVDQSTNSSVECEGSNMSVFCSVNWLHCKQAIIPGCFSFLHRCSIADIHSFSTSPMWLLYHCYLLLLLPCYFTPQQPFPPSNPWMCMPSQAQYGYQSLY